MARVRRRSEGMTLRTARGIAGALVLLALTGCSADAENPEPTAGPAADPGAQIAAAPSTGPHDVGDVVPAGEDLPHEARRETAQRLAAEHDAEFVWVTDAYSIAEGGEVVETYYAVDATGEISDRLSAEWMMFTDPDEALAYAENVVAEADSPERYEIVPYEL